MVTGAVLIYLDLSGLEMVVLSACETGLGEVADGQGVWPMCRVPSIAAAGTRTWY